MMPLHTNIPLEEVRSETERFDFLQPIVDHIVRVDEIHASDDNDSQYIFNVWIDPDLDPMKAATEVSVVDTPGWDTRVRWFDTGLLVVVSEIAYNESLRRTRGALGDSDTRGEVLS